MYFKDANEFQDVLGAFLAKTMNDPKISNAFASTNALVKVAFSDPEAVMWLDCRKPTPAVWSETRESQVTEEPDMVLTMTADNGHRFWLGRLSLPIALANRKVKVKGSTAMLMKLLPVLKPVYRGYEQFLIEQGRDDLVAV